MPASTAPKRTRRLENPFDARLEVRMYSTELAQLKVEAAKVGLSASDFVRSKLGKAIAAEPPEAPERPSAADPTETPASPPEEPQALTSGPQTIDLAHAIADVTGMSWGQAALKIRLGKVTIDGEVWKEQQATVDQLRTLALEGEALPIEPVEQERA